MGAGYTGFMPSGMSIGLPTKGAVVHVGKPPSDKEIAVRTLPSHPDWVCAALHGRR